MSLIDLERARLASMLSAQRDFMDDKVETGLPDMRKMSRDALLKAFPKQPHDPDHIPGSPVNDSRLMRTLIWQIYLLIMNGEVEPMHGNMRTFWYRVVEPLYVRNGFLAEHAGPDMFAYLDSGLDLSSFIDWPPKVFATRGRRPKVRIIEGDGMPEGMGDDDWSIHLYGGEGGAHGAYLLNLMSRVFDKYVILGIFEFRTPFDFKDPRENFHVVGTKRPSILFFTEKEGLWWLAQEFAKTYGISAMASHGEPGLLTIEYFLDQLRKRKVARIKLGALTDYDPWGYKIAQNCSLKLGLEYGKLDVHLSHLTSLDLFTPEVIEDTKRDLTKVSPGKQKEVKEWMKITHGIDGKPYSLHVDNAEIPRIRAAVKDWYEDIMKAPAHPQAVTVSVPVSQPTTRRPAAAKKQAAKKPQVPKRQGQAGKKGSKARVGRKATTRGK